MQVGDKSQAVDGTKVTDRIAGAFKAASEATGTSFDYLVSTSGRESDHRTDLASSTSTAKGLFQFVDQTWLGLIKREGASVGLERLANEIVPDGKGGWTVADLAEKTRILALKSDPLVASVMAGKFTQENARQLEGSLGRTPTDGELYAAHVLGATGATKLMRMAKSEPGTTAAVAFPRAAAANPTLFYGKGGVPRTAAELLGDLTKSRDTAQDPTSKRLAETHAVLSAQAASRKTDPRAVALLVRAQAAALVGKESAGAATAATPTAAGEAADSRYARTALSGTAMPGSATGSSPAMAGGLTGWRAGAAQDAFTTMMRSDAAAADGNAALGAAATVSTGAQLPPPAAVRIAGGGVGGIALVDTSKPMNLVGTAETARAMVTTVTTTPSTSVEPARRSRLVAAAGGGPDMPLPMVDAGTGATRPSRLLFDAYGTPDASVAPGNAVRVHTTTVTAPASTAQPAATPAVRSRVSSATRAPRLPPVPDTTVR